MLKQQRPLLSSPLVDEEMMSSGHWSGSVIGVSISGFTPMGTFGP